MTRSLVTAVCLSVALASSARAASEVENALRTSAGMQADFVHRFTAHGFKTQQVERGSVSFGAAPRMRWEYSKPERKTFVFDGSTSWLYSPAERQVTVTRLGEKQKREIPFVILSDPAQLQRFFTIRERQKGGLTISEFKPRDRYAAVREITATIDRAKHQIKSLSYLDRQGNRTVFEFSNYRKAPPSALAFRFTPPPGVDVIESQ